MNNKNWMENLTWRCHVCNRERPDDKISVAKHVHVYPSGMEVGSNVRYCNDNDDCRRAAAVRGFTELKLEIVTQSLKEAWAETHRAEKMFWHGLAFGFAIGFLIPLAYGISL